jgi:succinyl-CoA synthetase beta subunit
VILYEHEAKALLATYGVAVPESGLYPDVPHKASVAAPLVAKVQLDEGGRGKRGGVRIVRSPEDLAETVEQFRSGTESLPPVDTILIEDFVPGRRETYLALLVDRDAGRPVLLASAAGGVDIEDQTDGVIRIPVSILDERLSEQVRIAVTDALGGAIDRGDLDRLLDGLWTCFRGEECVLLEINPCAELADGSLMALDAKMVLDDNARRRSVSADRSATASVFESQCAAVGVSATELDGDIGIIVSGAGLAMATLDLVVGLGGRPRCIVDLGYSTLQSGSDLRHVVDKVLDLGCRVILVNGFLQMASCRLLATTITSAARGRVDGPVVVARLAGNEADDARAAIAAVDGYTSATIGGACRTAALLATAGGR